jgi:predicted RNase H-like nuclease
MTFIVAGFDSAWGSTNKGAVAFLTLGTGGKVGIQRPPETVSWNSAADVLCEAKPSLIAIDQPLVVRNATAFRPLERFLAEKLYSAHCAAYPANLTGVYTKPLFGDDAPIWKLLENLESNGYVHDPYGVRGIANRNSGMSNCRAYFECYPHLGILGLSGRNMILKYKVRHRCAEDWNELLTLLDRCIVDFNAISDKLSRQNKANEDKLDAVVCAVVAAKWAMDDSSGIVGSLDDGYMVTPLSEFLRDQLSGGLAQGDGVPPVRAKREQLPTAVPRPAEVNNDGQGWCGPERMKVNDMNLWRSRNDWLKVTMGFTRLSVLVQDDNGPFELHFVPYHDEEKKGGDGVKFDPEDTVDAYWRTLSTGACNKNILEFPVMYRYE